MTPSGEIRPKWLTVAQLKRVLADMPDDLLLFNGVPSENLSVCKGTWPDIEVIGQIDFLGPGEFQHFTD